MPALGILFDIDGLGGGFYGRKAYRLLFTAVERDLLLDCELFDGDTRQSLSGEARFYCIALSMDAARLSAVRAIMNSKVSAGLAPVGRRFLDDAAVRGEPLVFAARLDRKGELLNCQTPWILEAWQEAQPLVEAEATQSDLDWAWRRLHAP